MKKKVFAILTASLMMLSLLAGCGAPADDANAPADSGSEVYEIGFVSANFGTPFQVSIMDECKAVLDSYGIFNVDCQDGKDDPATQTTIIENMITEGKDLIIVVPAQTDSLVPAIRECNAANIPVIVVNRSLGEGAEILTEVNMDAVEAGRLQAQMADEVCGGEGKIAYILGVLGSGPQVNESQGFYEYLEEHEGLEVVFEQNADWDKAKAIQVVENLLIKYPAGEIDCIVCQGPDDAIGAAEACKAAGRTELLGKITAFDYPSYVKEGILAGEIYGSVNQSPKVQGVLAAEVAYEYFTNPDATFEKFTAMDLEIVNIDNCEDIEVAW